MKDVQDRTSTEELGANRHGARSRTILLGALLVVGVAWGYSSTQSAAPATKTTTSILTQAEQQAMTPDEALELLKAGNRRFVAGERTPRDYMAYVRATAGGQYPMAVVLGCIDSRVPAEIVFDQNKGDLFVARVAGNFENTDILGSMEFATKVAGSKLILVLGHTECGAIKGACDGVEFGNLTSTLANITPAVEASKAIPGDHNSSNTQFVEAVTHANVRQTMADIVSRSSVMKELVDAGELAVVGGIYNLQTGAVEWLEN